MEGKIIMRSLKNDNDAFIFTIVALIIGMLVLIWLISTIASLIVPLAIFLILAIILATLIKRWFFGGESLGITEGFGSAGRSIGRETSGLIKSARSEYRSYKKPKLPKFRRL